MASTDKWKKWAQILQQKKLSGFVLVLLDSFGPLRMILAQSLLGASIFIDSNNRSEFQAFAQMVEDPSASRTFADYLRTEELP